VKTSQLHVTVRC